MKCDICEKEVDYLDKEAVVDTWFNVILCPEHKHIRAKDPLYKGRLKKYKKAYTEGTLNEIFSS